MSLHVYPSGVNQPIHTLCLVLFCHFYLFFSHFPNLRILPFLSIFSSFFFFHLSILPNFLKFCPFYFILECERIELTFVPKRA